jgi:hypothetical protein
VISVVGVSFPNENRTIWREAALSGFIARTTWEGSSESARPTAKSRMDGGRSVKKETPSRRQ